jgi:hypothetical protein
MQAANLEGVITSTAAGALWIPGRATRLFYKFWIYLLTYTSNQNEKLCVFAVLILVSSLTYSVVYLLSQNPNALEGSKYPNISIAIVVNITFCILMDVWTKWFAITERIKAKPIKKDFNVLLTRSEEKNTWTV